MDAQQRAVIEVISRRYLWWAPSGDGPHETTRMLAQIMNLGTYDDIRRVEALVEPAELVQVLASAQPGWFSPRSWSFWKGRLSAVADRPIPEEPPKRSFSRAAML